MSGQATPIFVGGSGGGSYTDEEAQDAVGSILSASFQYVDATPAINLSAAVLASLALADDALLRSGGTMTGRIISGAVESSSATLGHLSGSLTNYAGVYFGASPTTFSFTGVIYGGSPIDHHLYLGSAAGDIIFQLGGNNVARFSTNGAKLDGLAGNGAGIVAVSNTGLLSFASGLEGTSVKSTGEVGGTKFLREDGDENKANNALRDARTILISGD